MRRIRYQMFDEVREGWFHGWAGTSEHAYAIVEWDDGSIHRAHDTDVQFIASYTPPEVAALVEACRAHLFSDGTHAALESALFQFTQEAQGG